MSKIDNFRDGIKNMMNDRGFFVSDTEDKKAEYMSDMKNWLCVHATNYMPRRNKDKKLYIPTTAMATGYKYPRATVHVTLNQIVASNNGGNWDAQPIVILMPYNDVVKKNGTPRMVASDDTFFIPDADTGLLLPESTVIVRPNNDTLFNIGDKVSTYKTDHFTDEEIETILSFNPRGKEEYEKYDKCDFKDYELEHILSDELVRKNYKESKNKRAFLRGLLEETRMVILTKFLREFVVRKTMEKMGYKYVVAHEDKASAAVCHTAIAKGIDACSHNKGHSSTRESDFENIGGMYLEMIEKCETNDIEKIYEYCELGWSDGRELAVIISTDAPFPDVYQMYVQNFQQDLEIRRNIAEFAIDQAAQYPDPNMPYYKYYHEEADRAKEDLKHVEKLERGGLAGYNPNLDIVLRRNAARLNQQFIRAMEKLRQTPDFPLLKKMLKDLSTTGKRWFKNSHGKWEPESDLNYPEPPISYSKGKEM